MFSDKDRIRQSAGVSPRPGRERILHRVNLFCGASNARQVFVAGDFNDWNPAATPMARMPDGDWMAHLELPHGHHRYVFLVDGQSVLDPNASGTAWDERNQRVSLIAVS